MKERRTNDPQPRNWPAWFYGSGGEARIFERCEDVPQGWRDAPHRKEPASGRPKRKGKT